ncbi:hypothetical protein D9757_010946 [Collybiopsis confluens]|uniref:NADH-ubiquinone oxidoreductase 78 kDa subunit, mitochondrial n=1 Tax=Collybiopsis confluens TaxID=2823264 RepID=A0A8H5GJ78_9AGAR|nr:hypothetical protein D9757_010946 [Collybiopsis confluens]
MIQSMPPRNIILFGTTGCGKSSIVNMLLGEDKALVASGAKGCTFRNEMHTGRIYEKEYRIFDTIGLDQPGPEDRKDHLVTLYQLLRDLEDGVSLLVYCMRGPRYQNTLERNYNIFYDGFCRKQVPIVIIVTGLEDYDDMESWWVDNEAELSRFGMTFSGHACITATRGKESGGGVYRSQAEYDASEGVVRKLIVENCRESTENWKMETNSWLASVLRSIYHNMPSWLEELVGPRLVDLYEVLAKFLPKADAREIADRAGRNAEGPREYEMPLSDSEIEEEQRHFSNVITTFRNYVPYHLAANNRRRKDLFSLPQDDQKLLDILGYKEKLDQVDHAILANEQFLNKIVIDPEIFGEDEELENEGDAIAAAEKEDPVVHPSKQEHSPTSHPHSHQHSSSSHSHTRSHTPSSKKYKPTDFDMDKLRSTLKQFVRDWSIEGEEERTASYGPMKDALLAHFSDIPKAERRNFRVLVPGAGLGRLAYDVASLGFALDISSICTTCVLKLYPRTEQPQMHTIYPYVHSFSNLPDRPSLLRSVAIPDVVPTLTRGSSFSLVAGDFEEIYGGESHPDEPQHGLWDAVMTCFFIDTAKNILNYLRVIYKILAPGGVWINMAVSRTFPLQERYALIYIKDRRSLSTTSARQADITLTVDGKEVTVPQGSALIQACEAAGSTIPRFCYHDRLAIAGNCRMCLVEVERSPKPVASCAMPAMPGSKVWTNTPLVHEAREGVMEFLLANHPLDCPICDQGGECDLQDQSMRYGSDRTRFHEITGKRAVENKDLGPLVKTSMNRCIQCTRCVRFANEVAGVEELGTTGRGNDLQIGMYVEKTMNSELSGNVVDLCPVGALTSKPYAFAARPWELKNTESIDVHDALGSNIRVDSRGVQVMRIQPKTNDDVNEEWISDKTRYSYDGLRYQRLTTPLVKQGDRFVSTTWEEALATIANGLATSGAKDNEIQAVAGHLADTESLVALKDLTNRLGSDNLTLDQVGGTSAPVHGVDVRSNYLFNSTIPGVEEADVILLVGTNPRHEAAVLNSRIRKSWLHSGLEVGLIGERADTTYGYDYLGADAKALSDFIVGKGEFAKKFKVAKKPLIIVGSTLAEHADGAAAYNALSRFVEVNKSTLLTPDWNGFSVLQRVASRPAAYDIGFIPSATASKTKPKFIYLLNADEIDPATIPQDAFVVYQGHHGDIGAQLADVCLPGAAYTEKSSTWINTEGRSQLGRAAVPPPGASREDWKIIRALSEVVGAPLPYDDVLSLRDRLWEISPSLVRYDIAEPTSAEVALAGLKVLSKSTSGAKVQGQAFKKPISNFYQTDVISRNSVTMAQCTRAFIKGENYGFTEGNKSEAAYA